MKKIYHLYIQNPFEAEGFFAEDGKLLAAWHCNDANWRNEYMDPFLATLGYSVEDLPSGMAKKATKALTAYFGL